MGLLLPRRKASGIDVADVFSTDLYTGNSSTQTITNGIDLSGEGGLVWLKRRNSSTGHNLFDTNRGAGRGLSSQLTNSESYSGSADGVTSFNADGFGINNTWFSQNASGGNYAAWTFRNSPGFFDVVTYTGDGVAGRTISHDLGQDVGMLVVKCTSINNDWPVWHRSPNSGAGRATLNSTNQFYADNGLFWGDGSTTTAPTSENFTVGSHTYVNASGQTYVAYLFAHDDSDNGVIQLGSYTGNGSATGPVIDLGWEPQWLMIKRTDSSAGWVIYDNQRSASNPRQDFLLANVSDAESSSSFLAIDFTSTGFQPKGTGGGINTSGGTYAYMAIRKEGA